VVVLRALCLGSLLLLVLVAGRARADQLPLVATAPFDGREQLHPPKKPIEPSFTASVVYEALAVKSVGRPYRVLAPDLWTGMARVKHQGQTADVRGMARLLGARLVLSGYVEATGSKKGKPYRLSVWVYSADGVQLGKQSFDLDRSLLQPAAFADKAAAIQQLIEQALLQTVSGGQEVAVSAPSLPKALPSQTSPTVTASPSPVQIEPVEELPTVMKPGSALAPPVVGSNLPQRTGQITQYEDSEEVQFDPNKPRQSLVPLSPEARDMLERRPPWQSALELGVGYVYSTRLLQNEGSDLRFGRSGTHGMVLLGELHPLALLPSSGAWLSGLGLRAQVVLPFWADIAHVREPGQPASGTYTASELRYDVALRAHVNPWNLERRPDVALELLYGEHTFQTAAKSNIDYLRIPPASYRYVGGALHVRLFLTRRFSIAAGGTLAKHLSLGLQTRPGIEDGSMTAARDKNGFLSYGPGSGFQWRFEATTQVNVYRGLTFGARFFLEQNRLSFEGNGNILTTSAQPVTSAKDEYLGVMATVGYTYQPRLFR
jgi:hypothetical protein